MLQAQDQAERISIHALCEEGDSNAVRRSSRCRNFYPRPLRGGRPGYRCVKHNADPFLSTPSARRATGIQREQHRSQRISIHALCEEGDRYFNCNNAPSNSFLSTPSARRATLIVAVDAVEVVISIHALCEEGDREPEIIIRAALEFLSTPSARRATAKTETKSLFSNKLYNILHEFRRALIYNGSKSYPNHAK